jgi:phosphoglycolate phosphatase
VTVSTELLMNSLRGCRSRKDAATKFKQLGIEGVESADIITSSFSVASYLRVHPGFEDQTAMVVGMSGIFDELSAAGIPTVAAACSSSSSGGTAAISSEEFRGWEPVAGVGAVVVGMDAALSYPQIARAALQLQDPRCLFLATNLDAADNVGGAGHPRLMPGAGAAVGALAGCTNRQPLNCGKGGTWILELLQREFQLEPERTLMVVGSPTRAQCLVVTRSADLTEISFPM